VSNDDNRRQEDDERIAREFRAFAKKHHVKIELTAEDRRIMQALESYRNSLFHSLRSVPSTQAVSATLTTTGAQSLQPYNVPQQVIARIAQEQAQQIMEKNIIPLIEETAKTTVQEHEKQEKAHENTLIEKAKRGGNEVFWIIVAFVLGSLLTFVLSALGIHFQ
jgi:cell fate regulator YaaT (PSP1 superfamily)